jgi:hypothetical protein
LTNNCLIFGQPILGRGSKKSCSQRYGLAKNWYLKNVQPGTAAE